MTQQPKEGDLRIWYVAAAPGKSYRLGVDSPATAKLLIETLTDFDDFLVQQYLRDDNTNAAGLEVYENGEWVEWYSEEGDDIDNWDADNGYLWVLLQEHGMAHASDVLCVAHNPIQIGEFIKECLKPGAESIKMYRAISGMPFSATATHWPFVPESQ